MKKVEIVSVGTELLMGQIANTNAQFISRRIPEAGWGVYYHSVVGDNDGRLQESLKLALSRSDVVITTGGLGPTQDDLTKDTVAKVLGLNMVMHEPSMLKIKEYFQRAGRVMVESNFRQAYFPEGSIILENDEGTAPGCIVNAGEQIIVMLPGPPKELIPMFCNSVMPYFMKASDDKLFSRFLRVVGVGESLVEKRILALVERQTNPTVATYAKDGNVTIRVTAHGEGQTTGRQLVDRMCEEICDILGDTVYTKEDEELEYVVNKMLKERGYTLACAESCTGGLIAQMITSVPGSSAIFKCSAVTYSNDSKVNLINVANDVIDEFGVVSAETALSMVTNISALSGADISVAVTGYAGPKCGDEPVGTVFIAIKAPGVKYVKEYCFSGNRDRIRTVSAITALDMIRRSMLPATKVK